MRRKYKIFITRLGIEGQAKCKLFIIKTVMIRVISGKIRPFTAIKGKMSSFIKLVKAYREIKYFTNT